MKEKNHIRILPLLLLTALALSGTAAAMDYGAFFVYQNETGLPDGVWTYGAATVTVTDGDLYPGENFVQGTYKQGDHRIFVSYPTASYHATAALDEIYYLVENNGIVYEGSDLYLNISSVNNAVPATELFITYPNGTVMRYPTADYTLPAETQTGTYKIQALFEEAYFVPGTPVILLLDQNSFAFTVVEETAASISSSVDTVYNGDAVAVTITGMPGREYTIEVLGFDIIENQILEIQKTETPNQYKFTMWNSGEAAFYLAANTTGNSASVKLVGVDNAKVVVRVVTGSSTGGGGTITPNSTLPSSLTLQNGWNFVSVPKALAASANTASKLFANVDTADRAILAYDASGQKWDQVEATTVIKPLTGYWIYSNSVAAVPLSYVTDPTVPAVKQLYTGWNAVGVSAHEAVTADTVFSGTSWRVALPWNLSEGLWGRAVVNGGGASNSAEQYMTLGNGIWLYVDTNGTMIGLTA